MAAVLHGLQSDLRALALESGRRNKDVKEASERGIVKLRSLLEKSEGMGGRGTTHCRDDSLSRRNPTQFARASTCCR